MRVSVGVKKLTLLRPIGDVKWCRCCEKQNGVPQKVKKIASLNGSEAPLLVQNPKTGKWELDKILSTFTKACLQ